MMRVGLVCPYAWDVPGGVMAHVEDLRVALERLGHEVQVLAPAEDEQNLPDYVTFAGKPVAVPFNGSVARVVFGPGPVARARRWVRDGDFDVIHCHEPAGPSLSLLTIWASTGPIVATWHIAMPSQRAIGVAAPMVQGALEKVRARIAVSEYARRTSVEYTGGDAVLIPNGVDCSKYTESEPLPGHARGAANLLFLGRIDEPRKGLAILLEALPSIAEAHPNVHLLVAGPGDVDEVRDGLDPRIADRVEFLGMVSEEDKVRAYHSADIYVAPNTGGESFGIVLLEAMASGAPVLASNIDAFQRVCDEGRAGVHFRNEDAADLSRVCIDLLADPGERARLTEGGLRRSKEFDWATVAKKVVHVYESVRLPGEKVEPDLSGHFFGRLARRFGGDDE